jgi:hypothetical protein
MTYQLEHVESQTARENPVIFHCMLDISNGIVKNIRPEDIFFLTVKGDLRKIDKSLYVCQ